MRPTKDRATSNINKSCPEEIVRMYTDRTTSYSPDLPASRVFRACFQTRLNSPRLLVTNGSALDPSFEMTTRIAEAIRGGSSIGNWRRAAYTPARSVEMMDLPQMTGNTDDSQFLPSSQKSQSSKRSAVRAWNPFEQRFPGWRLGVFHFACFAFIVLCINLSVTLWIVSDFDQDGGVYQLIKGDCGQVKNMNRLIHIVINVFSSILLSGSNYCMQCLSAPTRTDIDRAHTAENWLDIGIPSIRNLEHISRRRFYLWLLLGLSSIPLHLL